MAHILIIDDDRDFRDTLAETVRSLGHQPTTAASGQEGLATIQRQPVEAVFLDYRMPGMDGLEVLRRLMAAPATAQLPVIMLTAFATGDNTIEAMRLGAFDHLIKPASRDDISKLLTRALAGAEFRQAANGAKSDALVGASPAMRAVQKLIGRSAASETTVLVTGESGVGKELVARAIHGYGPRSSKAFVAVNCAAIPGALLESELFGHEKGAFTGATERRKGLFQAADGGTLFLDEIGDMELALQPKVLRAVDERMVLPVGATRPITIDVRIIAATHRDLAKRIAEGTFREDLYYRLAVLPIHVPSLRERREDIVPLAEHFLGMLTKPARTITPAAVAKLESHSWPGNVRELRNVIERAVVMTRNSRLDAADIVLPEGSSEAAEAVQETGLSDALARMEERLIRNAMRDAKNNRAEAARRLGIRRQLLYSKLKQYGIES